MGEYKEKPLRPAYSWASAILSALVSSLIFKCAREPTNGVSCVSRMLTRLSQTIQLSCFQAFINADRDLG
jgi:hypothetical protein